MMKKILKLTLAFAMILVSLFGLTTLLAVNVPAVHLDVELISSDNIVAKVSIPEGFDIGGWKIELTYDGDKLVMEENPTDNDEVGVVNFGASGNRIIATQASITPYQNETEIYDVTFSLKESASFDENTITITSWRIADTSATVLSSSNDTDTVVHINCLHAVTSSKVTKEATCTEAGEETTVCSLCGEIISTKEIATLGHDIGEWIITKQPTCTEKGVESRECSRCHEILETREIDTITHIFGEWKIEKEATCVEDGSEQRVCQDCKEVDTRVIQALGHDYGEWTVIKQSTCTEDGIEESVCQTCEEKVTRTIPTTDHIFGEWKIEREATCAEEGSEQRVCEDCGEVDTRVIPVLGHDYGEWTITKQPTCTEEGIEEKVCQTCGEKVINSIPVINHKFSEWKTIKEATCTENGSEQRVCKVCGEIESRELLALGHSFEEWIITKPATGIEEGSKERGCSVCGEKEITVIDKLIVNSKPSDNNGDSTNNVKTGDIANTQLYMLYVIVSIVMITIVYCLEKKGKILNK